MYIREDKLKEVELFTRYDFSPQSVISELGYPCRESLYNWCEEYLSNGNDIPDVNPYKHYSEGLKRVAVDHTTSSTASAWRELAGRWATRARGSWPHGSTSWSLGAGR